MTNDGAHTGTTQPHSTSGRQRVTTADLEKIRQSLSDRNYAILRSVFEHRFLTVGQIEVLHFANHATISGPRIARRVLAQLRDLRLLGALDRRIGGIYAGSQGLVHYVDVVGDRILHDRSGRSSHRPYEPTDKFVRHTLAVADARVALVAAHRAQQIELTDSSVEPASWRTFTGTGGARLTLKPDLYAETTTAPGSELVTAWFLEIDLGTESIPTLLRKCRDYEAYRRSGIEQDRHGSFPLVIWSMTHQDPAKARRRRDAFNDAIATDRTLTNELFRIVAPEQLLPLIQWGATR
ncbi:replication-relaxation family protein [Mycobacteroides abscessus]|uniref:replication-relaxation family protein n=1 Tax=Mycobacteroides abscessus TaxID=36809 RepID=UPI001F1F44D5|nr:replication-relaxation family protein [Mycobacteroides abscessus]